MASIGMDQPTAHAQTGYSGWWKRVGATLIDGLILLVPALILGAAAGAALGESGGVVVVPVILIAALLYAPLLMARDGDANGQTFGKQAVGIRVVHDSGQPMTIGRGVVRDFVGKTVLGLVPFYSLIDVLFPLWDDRKQAIHDKVGSTTVHTA